MKKNIILLLLLGFGSGIYYTASAQDPSFSQFYASPLNISPALAGSGSADWRVITNFRNQSIGNQLISLNTTSLSFDGKIIKQQYRSSNYVGMGLMVLQDAGLAGAYRNNIAQLSVSSHVSLDEEDKHGLCAGLGVVYNNTIVKPDMIDYSSQISFNGFDPNISTLEDLAMFNYRPNYFSVTAGLCYTFTSDKANFDLGVSGYRFTAKNRSVLGNQKIMDQPRYNVHADFQTYLNDRLVVNINTVYTSESYANTIVVGANFGRIMALEDLPTVLNAGLWYRKGTTTSIIPYLGIMYKNMQAGITYDININKAKDNSTSLLRTFELSLIFRKPGKNGRLMDSFGK
ncbi:MAG: PorP/SprF family type IX secretion system membrane protein [Chitinophagia bacterium]